MSGWREIEGRRETSSSWSRQLGPAALAAAGLLALNDYLLKRHFPGVLSGKLSDVAVCFLLPLYLSTLFGLPARGVATIRLTAACFVTAGLFTLLELSVDADGVFCGLNEALLSMVRGGGRGRCRLTRDPSDLLALVFVPLAWLYGRHRLRRVTASRRAGRGWMAATVLFCRSRIGLGARGSSCVGRLAVAASVVGRLALLGATTGLLLATSVPMERPQVCRHPMQALTFTISADCGPPGSFTVTTALDDCRVSVEEGSAALGLPSAGQFDQFSGESQVSLGTGAWTLDAEAETADGGSAGATPRWRRCQARLSVLARTRDDPPDRLMCSEPIDSQATQGPASASCTAVLTTP